jgi:uncharacterized protein DUF4864
MRRKAMRRILLALALIPALLGMARADDAGVAAAQSTIDGQLKAFLADDDATAYSYAAPNVKKIFPTLESFTGMVAGSYRPVQKPRSYSFGKIRVDERHDNCAASLPRWAGRQGL